MVAEAELATFEPVLLPAVWLAAVREEPCWFDRFSEFVWRWCGTASEVDACRAVFSSKHFEVSGSESRVNGLHSSSRLLLASAGVRSLDRSPCDSIILMDVPFLREKAKLVDRKHDLWFKYYKIL